MSGENGPAIICRLIIRHFFNLIERKLTIVQNPFRLRIPHSGWPSSGVAAHQRHIKPGRRYCRDNVAVEHHKQQLKPSALYLKTELVHCSF